MTYSKKLTTLRKHLAKHYAAKHLASLAVLAVLPGCLATRGYVDERLNPVGERLAVVERGLSGSQADIARLTLAMSNLKLERKLVLDMREGATFAVGSSSLSPGAKGEIDRFLQEIQERQLGAPASGTRVFVVAGHTDGAGSEEYNAELGKKRADVVASYLLARHQVDPLGLSVVSYGESAPLGDNKSSSGRKQNRRVEVLVYGERVGSE